MEKDGKSNLALIIALTVILAPNTSLQLYQLSTSVVLNSWY